MDFNNARDLQNSPNIWSVVEFLEELCEIEVVPTSWLERKEDKILCKWPHKNPRKCIRKNVQPDSSWEVYRVQLLTTSDSYQKALNYAKRKSNSDTETSCSQLGKGKRRKKHKSQDVSDNSDSDPQKMTPPPSIIISYDIRTDPCDELLHDKTAPILLSQELNNDLSIHKDDERNYNNINTEKDIVIIEGGGDFNDNGSGTSTAIVNEVDKEVQENNIAAIMTNKDENFTIPGDIIIEDLRTDNHVLLKILHNVLATRKMVEQQNEFLKQLDSRININVASNATAATNPNIIQSTANIIPTKPYNKYRTLLKFDNDLRTNITASKQLEMFFYLLGGNTAQVLSKNGLEKLFTNKLGAKCSWFGRKGNYQLSSLYTMEILKILCAIRKHFPNYTNKNFQDHVSTWFKYAKTRYLREAGRDAEGEHQNL